CVVVPPTAFTIQAGRLGKSCDTRQLPDVVRLSSQASCAKLSHSSLMKSSNSWRFPASRITTSMPFWASSLPSVPPPAPEPMMTTTLSSLRSYGAAIVSSQCFPVSATKVLAGGGCRFVTGVFLAPGRLQPFDIVEAALDVAALG